MADGKLDNGGIRLPPSEPLIVPLDELQEEAHSTIHKRFPLPPTKIEPK